METKGDFITGARPACEVDSDLFDFAIDTAGSWDGSFPNPHKGDFLVTIQDYGDGESHSVLVSSRYTEAVDFDDAAELALDAYEERVNFHATVTSVDAIED
jgi:hypothetical protein